MALNLACVTTKGTLYLQVPEDVAYNDLVDRLCNQLGYSKILVQHMDEDGGVHFIEDNKQFHAFLDDRPKPLSDSEEDMQTTLYIYQQTGMYYLEEEEELSQAVHLSCVYRDDTLNVEVPLTFALEDIRTRLQSHFDVPSLEIRCQHWDPSVSVDVISLKTQQDFIRVARQHLQSGDKNLVARLYQTAEEADAEEQEILDKAPNAIQIKCFVHPDAEPAVLSVPREAQFMDLRARFGAIAGVQKPKLLVRRVKQVHLESLGGKVAGDSDDDDDDEEQVPRSPVGSPVAGTSASDSAFRVIATVQQWDAEVNRYFSNRYTKFLKLHVADGTVGLRNEVKLICHAEGLPDTAVQIPRSVSFEVVRERLLWAFPHANLRVLRTGLDGQPEPVASELDWEAALADYDDGDQPEMELQLFIDDTAVMTNDQYLRSEVWPIVYPALEELLSAVAQDKFSFISMCYFIILMCVIKLFRRHLPIRPDADIDPVEWLAEHLREAARSRAEADAEEEEEEESEEDTPTAQPAVPASALLDPKKAGAARVRF